MITKVLGNVLKKVSGSMITKPTASCCCSGVEDMPESMKKLR